MKAGMSLFLPVGINTENIGDKKLGINKESAAYFDNVPRIIWGLLFAIHQGRGGCTQCSVLCVKEYAQR